jgi:hypothetical protein
MDLCRGFMAGAVVITIITTVTIEQMDGSVSRRLRWRKIMNWP